MKRFILLNDNKIIDTNKFEINSFWSDIYFPCLHYTFRHKNKGKTMFDETKTYTKSSIIKQADNLCELIEEEHLIESGNGTVLKVAEIEKHENYYTFKDANNNKMDSNMVKRIYQHLSKGYFLIYNEGNFF